MWSSANGCGFVDHPIKNPKKSLVDIYYQNVRGLRTKLEEFYIGVSSSNVDLLAITETGLNESICDAEIIPPGYTIIRCDRADGRKQGGACLVATPRLDVRRIPVPGDVNIDDRVFELVSATVYLGNRFLFLICVAYIPPNSSENEYLCLFKIIEQFCNNYNEVVVLGDFNLYSCSASVNSYYNFFVTYCGFTQSNEILNCNDRCLDLVLTTYEEGEGVCVRAAEEPLVAVDAYHPPLQVSVSSTGRRCTDVGPAIYDSCTSDVNTQNGWNFNKADFTLLYSKIAAIDWTPLYNHLKLDMCLDYFYETLNNILDSCVPRKKQSRIRSRYIYPEWYTSEIICDIRRKATLHKQYKATGLAVDYEAFARCRTQVKRKLEIAEKQFRQRIQNHLARDPKSFWNYVNSKRGSRCKVKILKDGQALTGAQAADDFAKYFHSVYSQEKPKLNVDRAIAEAGRGNGAARIHLDKVNVDDVMGALQQLKPKTSSGPDGFPAFVFRDCRMVLAGPLLHIFNICLASAEYPERWKMTRVIPVPKGGSGTEVEEYRPVAVLSTPAKLLESVVQKNIHLQVRSQLADAQHGFRPARSTTTNLLSYVAEVVPTVDSGGQTDAAYFDFKKAFDLVDNDVLLKKLAAVGFTPHLLNFFANYMRDRQQYVDYAGYRTQPYYTRSGVSQGSNLGPLEFILMVNDLPDVIQEAKCLLFADDLKLSLAVRNTEDCETLQRDIDRVVSWSKQNRLQFNVSKCVTISFSRARAPIQYKYTVDGNVLTRVTAVKDLGVHFITELTFRDHILKICKKAYRNLGMVLRMAKGFTNIKAITALYNSLVRSQLECNAVVWAPHETKYSLMLERVQNKFIRFIYMKLYGVYPFYPLMYPTLFVLGMVGYNELRVRRELTLVTYIFTVIRGRVHNADILARVGLCVPDGYATRRRRPRLLAVPRARTKLLSEAPLTRALRTLNFIADDVDVFYCTLSEFTKIALFKICYGI